MYIDMIKKGGAKLEKVIAFLKANTKPLVLFGAGTAGETLFHELGKLGINAACFGDNNPEKQHDLFYGLEVLSPSELMRRYPGAVAMVSAGTAAAAEAVKVQLEGMGCFEKIIDYFYCPNEFYGYEAYIRSNAEAFETLCELLADEHSREVLAAHINCIIAGDLAFPQHLVDKDQYFDTEIIKLSGDEVFLDAGSFDGQTALDFASRSHGYKKIICLEPEKKNYERMVINTASLDRIEYHNLGVWECRKTFAIQSSGVSSRISQAEGNDTIEVASIDELFSNEKITFIKMDIEGAEMNALKGAKEIIKKQHPRMAVCVYHKKEDVLTIPLFLKGLNPDYRIYLRHYGPDIYETVCYAV